MTKDEAASVGLRVVSDAGKTLVVITAKARIDAPAIRSFIRRPLVELCIVPSWMCIDQYIKERIDNDGKD